MDRWWLSFLRKPHVAWSKRTLDDCGVQYPYFLVTPIYLTTHAHTKCFVVLLKGVGSFSVLPPHMAVRLVVLCAFIRRQLLDFCS